MTRLAVLVYVAVCVVIVVVVGGFGDDALRETCG